MSEAQPLSMPAPIAPSDVISVTYPPVSSISQNRPPPDFENQTVTKLGKRKRTVKSAKQPDAAQTAAPRPSLPESYRQDEKKRNKLGYHRTSVACAHCRRRKIRCITTNGEDGPCQTCIRLKKECHFYPVDQSSKPVKPPAKRARTENRGDAVSPSSSAQIPSATRSAIAPQHLDYSPLNFGPPHSKESDFIFSPDLVSPHYVLSGSRYSQSSVSQHVPPYYDQTTSSWDSGSYSAAAPASAPLASSQSRYFSYGDFEPTLSPPLVHNHSQPSHTFKGGRTMSPTFSGEEHPSPAYHGGASLASPATFHFQAQDPVWHHGSRSLSLGAVDDPYPQFAQQPVYNPRDALRRSQTFTDTSTLTTTHPPHASIGLEAVSTPATEPISLPSTSASVNYSTPQLHPSHQTQWGSYFLPEERYEKEGTWDSQGYIPGWP